MKKHGDKIKVRNTPVLQLQKQQLTDLDKDRLTGSMEVQRPTIRVSTNLPTPQTQVGETDSSPTVIVPDNSETELVPEETAKSPVSKSKPAAVQESTSRPIRQAKTVARSKLKTWLT